MPTSIHPSCVCVCVCTLHYSRGTTTTTTTTPHVAHTSHNVPRTPTHGLPRKRGHQKKICGRESPPWKCSWGANPTRRRSARGGPPPKFAGVAIFSDIFPRNPDETHSNPTKSNRTPKYPKLFDTLIRIPAPRNAQIHRSPTGEFQPPLGNSAGPNKP